MRERQRLGPPPASERRPRLGAEVDQVLAAGLAFDPAQRIASASEFARRLAEAIARLSDEESTPPEIRRPTIPPPSEPAEGRVRGDLLVAVSALAQERYGVLLPIVDGGAWFPMGDLRPALTTLAAAAARAGDDPGQMARAVGRRALETALGQGHAIAPVTRGPGALQGGLAQAWGRLSELGTLAVTQTSDRAAQVVVEQAQRAPDALIDVVAGFVDRFAEEAGLRNAVCDIETRTLPPQLALRWR
jgi:hypothetical protein